ncbi:hypothetical protein R84B8_02035 [Treponema sp. R8-4-B8]
MKNVFSLVMILSLLWAICGCSNDLPILQEPEFEVPEIPGANQKKPGENKPDFSYEEESDDADSEDTDQEDIEQEEADSDDIDYSDGQEPNDYDPADNDQDKTDNNESDFTETEPAEYIDFYLFSKKEIRFNFTAAVKNVSCTITPHQEIERVQDGKTVKVFLKENLELQTDFLIELNVIDNHENSLSVEERLFVNDWVPKIEINELRTEYSSSAKRAEYIEFKVKSAGDLNGLKLYIMYDAKKPYTYDFPSVDVKLGEYVTLHLRTLESTCVNELGENLSESAGTDSCPTARDLWVSGSEKLLHKTDIVYLEDANGRILDTIIMNDEPAETWKKNQTHFTGIIEDLFNKEAWKSADGHLPGPFDAVNTSTIKTSATKSVSRHENKENTHTANDWYVTDLNKASPGLPNK